MLIEQTRILLQINKGVAAKIKFPWTFQIMYGEAMQTNDVKYST